MLAIVKVLRAMPRFPYEPILHKEVAELFIAVQREKARRERMFERRLVRYVRKHTRWFKANSVPLTRNLLRTGIFDVDGRTRSLAMVGQPEPGSPKWDDCVGPDSEGEDSVPTPPPLLPPTLTPQKMIKEYII